MIILLFVVVFVDIVFTTAQAFIKYSACIYTLRAVQTDSCIIILDLIDIS